MALVATDFIAPQGKLQVGLFPGVDLVTSVTAWLAKAYTKTTQAGIEATYRDAAAEAYTYYLAYSHVADRLAGEPNSASIDSAASVSKSVGQDRIQYFARLAQEYLEEFEGYADIPPKAEKPRSAWVQNRVIF